MSWKIYHNAFSWYVVASVNKYLCPDGIVRIWFEDANLDNIYFPDNNSAKAALVKWQGKQDKKQCKTCRWELRGTRECTPCDDNWSGWEPKVEPVVAEPIPYTVTAETEKKTETITIFQETQEMATSECTLYETVVVKRSKPDEGKELGKVESIIEDTKKTQAAGSLHLALKKRVDGNEKLKTTDVVGRETNWYAI